MISLPIDGNFKVMQLSPATAALEETYDTSISTATSVTLNSGTTYIEVSAIDKGVFLKYAAGASPTDYDEFISADTTRAYVVPEGVTVISVIEESATAKVSIIEK